MSKRFIIIKDEIITHDLTGEPVNIVLEENEQMYNVPEYFKGVRGQNINEFNADFSLKSKFIRSKEGFIQTPKGYKYDEKSDDLIPLTMKEKIDSGLEIVDKKHKYDSVTDSIIPKTIHELFAEGIMSHTEYYEILLEECLNNRKTEYNNYSDGIFFDYQRGEKTKAEWEKAVSDIKIKYPKPDIEKL